MQIGSTVWDGTVRKRLDDLLRILSEDDTCRPQREERDSLEHWEDDGGASRTETLPNSFSVAFIDD
ncbi:MAG: hypothetical protein WBX22_06580 [Silvibacterium sp.]|jgi:hypothetical protein